MSFSFGTECKLESCLAGKIGTIPLFYTAIKILALFNSFKKPNPAINFALNR